MAAFAALAASAPGQIKPAQPGQFNFHLLPKPFQKHPEVDLSVITEMTDAGRKISPPTAERPAYYLAQTTGYHDEGQGITGQRPLPPEVLSQKLAASLASGHYLPASHRHPASLVLFFLWGSDNKLDTGVNNAGINEDGTADPSATPDIGHRNLLTRAALIGGTQFARDFGAALMREDELTSAGAKLGQGPVEEFESRDFLTRRLVEESLDDCYYVVVSAYDAAALAHGQRVLLWRTKMTTNSAGVAMAESLPELIIAGGPYFGKDMTLPAALTGHLVPGGHVEVGQPIVVPPKS